MIARVHERLRHHRYGLSLAIFLCAAAATGAGCVLFMWAFEFVMKNRVSVETRLTPWSWALTPALFLLSVELIRRAAPAADGSGIPQAIHAATHLKEKSEPGTRALVSMRTMWVKIAAVLLGLCAGASTGREGPTVHVAACLFFFIAFWLHRALKLPFDMRSAVVAGGAAGLAAAFNTPLAGVTFAIEELSADYFSSIKDVVLMAIIVAGIAAKLLTGEYVYFGKLAMPAGVPLGTVLGVGVAGGIAGAFFSTVLWRGRRALMGLKGWKRYALPVALAWAMLGVAWATRFEGVLGPGNEAAKAFLSGEAHAPAAFCASKMATTLFTYWSGIAGGIFAPCLSMGSALGSLVGGWTHAPLPGSALIGMAAFLAGTIQAPITAFVVIFEMTGRHDMMLPVMLSSLVAFMVARLLGAKHLYQTLASFYR